MFLPKLNSRARKSAWKDDKCLKCGNSRKEGHKRTCAVVVARRAK